jgi:hypothetical protein
MIAVIAMDDLNSIIDAKREELHAQYDSEKDHEVRMRILACLSALSDIRLATSSKLEIAHVFKVGA